MKNDILATTTRIDILPDKDYEKYKSSKNINSDDLEEERSNKTLGRENFQALLQSVYDGAIISDTSGNILDVNERACSHLECKRSDILESNIVSLIYGSDISLINNLQRSLKDNKYILIQAACIRSDETMFPAEISVNQLILSETTYFCFFVRDISVRMDTEKDQRTGNAAIQNAATGIATADVNGFIEYTNQALLNLWGIDDENILLGHNIRDFICDNETAEDIEQSISNRIVWRNELSCKTVNGNHFFVQASIAPNIDSEEHVIGMVLSLLDTTAITQANTNLQQTMQELQRSNEDLEQFAYAVSHDLQAPLRKIYMFADIIKDKAGDSLSETVNDAMGRMQNATKRMSDLISGLLQYSRVSTNEKNHKPLDLNLIINEVLSDLEVQLQESQANVTVAHLPEVLADQTLMRQLFQNLIGNALKFHKPQIAPIIEITARNLEPNQNRTGSYCEITVKDNGIGVPQKDNERIFGVFQRLHTQNEYEGTGIGLAICKKIAERHNTQLMVTSSAGNGASFKIELPANI